jgi:hypothetical protein
MELIMNEIFLLTSQFSARLVSVILLVSFTWFLAKFAQFVVGRIILQASKGSNNPQNPKSQRNIASRISFWAIFLIISPFILGAAGLDALWQIKAQTFIAGILSKWPILMLLSLLVAVGIKRLPTLPKLTDHFKRSPDTSLKEL